MADERDPDVSRRYRELGAEEPPRALDDAILAASRKDLKRKSWYGPLALAATLVLVVAVSIQVERQKPDEEFTAAQSPAPAAVEEKAELPLKEERVLKARPARPPQAASSPPGGFTPDPQPAAPELQSADALRDLAKSNEPAVRSDATGERRRHESESARPAPAPAPAPARPAMERPRAEMGAMSGAMAGRAIEAPEPWLERIAELRRQGKHEEADKALEEFRKRYPDYRLSDEVKAKVERK